MELFCSLNMWRSCCIPSSEKWNKNCPSTWQFISPPTNTWTGLLSSTSAMPSLSTGDQRNLGDLGNTWLPRSKLNSVNPCLLAITFISWPLLFPACLPLLLEAFMLHSAKHVFCFTEINGRTCKFWKRGSISKTAWYKRLFLSPEVPEVWNPAAETTFSR